ncbi:hypothetical protein M0805_002597 [Coniferiporia weirii]|nr:hypothetical protein M0805_002597 [Coniferiporia weirii]
MAFNNYILNFPYPCLVLTIFVAFAFAHSAGPSASRTRTATATPSPSAAPLCYNHPVQCCAGVTETNSTTASTILGKLGLIVPDKVVEMGYNCSAYTDEDVTAGYCDNYVICCQNVYNGTVVNGTITNYSAANGTIGMNCTDVAVAP